MARLSRRTALVTGAASGIRRASAKLFADEGASLILFDRADEVYETADASYVNGRAIVVDLPPSSSHPVARHGAMS